MTRKILTIGAMALGLMMGLGALAAEKGHRHDHGHDNGQGKLALDNGKKWETDVPLRNAMAGIRSDLAATIDRIHKNEFSEANYAELSKRVEVQLLSIVETCKLSPEADAQFHIILADLFSAVTEMRGENKKAAAIKMLQGLKTYGDHFEHPGWKAIEH